MNSSERYRHAQDRRSETWNHEIKGANSYGQRPSAGLANIYPISLAWSAIG